MTEIGEQAGNADAARLRPPSTTPQAAQKAAQEIDRYCFEESKALFLCAPHALCAVNKDVDFRASRRNRT
ncbi:MAG: hypothetical protein M3022_16810 [Actinomycetota bacterium]|nr:hypothetical protein [Actinomycetota bacterium]